MSNIRCTWRSVAHALKSIMAPVTYVLLRNGLQPSMENNIHFNVQYIFEMCVFLCFLLPFIRNSFGVWIAFVKKTNNFIFMLLNFQQIFPFQPFLFLFTICYFCITRYRFMLVCRKKKENWWFWHRIEHKFNLIIYSLHNELYIKKKFHVYPMAKCLVK